MPADTHISSCSAHSSARGGGTCTRALSHTSHAHATCQTPLCWGEADHTLLKTSLAACGLHNIWHSKKQRCIEIKILPYAWEFPLLFLLTHVFLGLLLTYVLLELVIEVFLLFVILRWVFVVGFCCSFFYLQVQKWNPQFLQFWKWVLLLPLRLNINNLLVELSLKITAGTLFFLSLMVTLQKQQ